METEIKKEVVREQTISANPGIPEIKKVKVGALCTLALPVKLAHDGNPCHFCRSVIDKSKPIEACPERPPVVGHFNKTYKLSAIRDGGATLILKRIG